MTFPTVGEYVFVAVFYNNASKANSTIPFGVVQGEWFLMFTINYIAHAPSKLHDIVEYAIMYTIVQA